MRNCKYRREEKAVDIAICVLCGLEPNLLCDYWDMNRQEDCPNYEPEEVISGETS